MTEIDKIMFNCGIVGYGYMGEIRERVITHHPKLRLVGIAEPNPGSRQKIQSCKAFESLDALLKENIDIIFVCTPNCYSPDICIRSMQAGKHVFCEKPPGRNLQDIKDIMRHETKDTKLMFGFNHRFHPGIVKAKTIVASGQLGEIVAVHGVYGKSGGKNFPASWRNNKEISGGGILLDQGIHMLDLFLYFCGDFQYVKAFLSNKYWQFNVEDNACVILKNRNDQIATLHSSTTFWKHQFRIHIILEKGYLTVEGLLSKTGSYGRETLIIGRQQFEDEAQALGNPSEEIVYFDTDRSWETEVNEMVRCVQEDKPVSISSSGDAYKVMNIIDVAYKNSMNQGVPFMVIHEES